MKKVNFLVIFGAMTMALASCDFFSKKDEPKDDGKIHVNFDTCIELKTNNIKEQVFDAPSKVKKPVVVIIDENPEKLEIMGWFKEKEFQNEWNFKTDIAEKSMTLYAKYVPQFDVNYYQGISENSMSLLATETVFKDEAVPVREDLPDCYENPGNYYVTNLKENSDGTLKGDIGGNVNFGVDHVNEEVNILLKKSENFYLSPSAIGRRFTTVAASSGQNGASLGKISVEKWRCSTCNKNFTDYQVGDEHICPECESVVISLGNEEYARVDFGQLSEKDGVCDPYIIMDNPQIDVTKSKEIEITVKNLGYGEAISFYWVGKWACNGSWINGKEFHSFNEEASFKIGNGIENNPQKGSISVDYKKEQLESDEWQTFVIPVSDKIDKGVSIWGCMGKVTALRIQSSFNVSAAKQAGKDISKLKNEILIKSIKGIDTHVEYEFKDTEEVSNIKSSSETELLEKANSQQEIDGFVFPKNNNYIVTDSNLDEHTTSDVTKRIEATYFHSNFVDGKQTILIKPSNDKKIILDTLTTFVFSYKNFSYVNSLTFSIGTKFEKNGKMQTKKILSEVSIKQSMSNFEEYKINFFGNANYKGELTEIKITYTPVGVNNMIGFEYFRFDEYEQKQINGIQFNDLYVAKAGGFVGDGDLSFEYNAEHKATKVDVTSSVNSLSKSISFNSLMNDSFNLNYINPTNSINEIKVTLTVDGTQHSYIIQTEVSENVITKKVDMALNERGKISDVSFEFHGSGTLYLKSLEWNFIEESLDLSNGEFYSKCSKNTTAMKNYTYNEQELGLSVSSNSSALYARLGAWGYTINSKNVTNLPLAGKTRIAVLYQNTGNSDTTNPYISFGAINKNDYLEENKYLTADAIPNTAVTINGVTKKPGVDESNRVKISKNMQSGEWDVVTYNIDEFFTSTVNECYLSCFYFQTATVSKTITIRAFAIL